MEGDRPHVYKLQPSRQGCFWSSINSSSCCSLGQFVAWFCLRPVRSIDYFDTDSSNSRCALYAEIRLIHKHSSVLVYACMAYGVLALCISRDRINMFSSPAVAVFCCETNRKPLFCSFMARVTSRPARVSASYCGLLVASHGQG